MKTLLLTGGSSGIGKAAVELFASKGYQVYELSRHGKSSEGIQHIDCDVTSVDDCQRAVKEMVGKTGHIDVLISNAGMGISGAVEFTTTEDLHRQMDVNFFGAVNISQAVLPIMRQQHKGRIIFVSSMAAVFAIPFQAFYSASKFAINGYAMALLNEVRPFGISVCCLLPGDVKTGFTAVRNKSAAGSDIYTKLEKSVSTMEHDEQNGIAPERMAKKLLKLAESKCPPVYSTVGLQYHLFNLLNKLVPATWVYKIVGMMY